MRGLDIISYSIAGKYAHSPQDLDVSVGTEQVQLDYHLCHAEAAATAYSSNEGHASSMPLDPSWTKMYLVDVLLQYVSFMWFEAHLARAIRPLVKVSYSKHNRASCPLTLPTAIGFELLYQKHCPC